MPVLRTALALAGFASALAIPSSSARPTYIKVQLLAQSAAPQPGHDMLIGLSMIPKPGWHGYWSNPGESGLAPVVRWSAPSGVHFGPLRHPAPTVMQVMGL
ncbi:MAG TPA: protein-disulfide reductase DsbD domain-containing protein, partial [Sphingomicrobium sp.]|nr:protein-disulfide reductase DsbD domain-containing protein [Sphingomicrobium sp.]